MIFAIGNILGGCNGRDFIKAFISAKVLFTQYSPQTFRRRFLLSTTTFSGIKIILWQILVINFHLASRWGHPFEGRGIFSKPLVFDTRITSFRKRLGLTAMSCIAGFLSSAFSHKVRPLRDVTQGSIPSVTCLRVKTFYKVVVVRCTETRVRFTSSRCQVCCNILDGSRRVSLLINHGVGYTRWAGTALAFPPWSCVVEMAVPIHVLFSRQVRPEEKCVWSSMTWHFRWRVRINNWGKKMKITKMNVFLHVLDTNWQWQ